MDPMMMSQGMFGGFNGGMAMNSLNMGMGFDGSYGGWTAGNNAMGAMGGMMNGDFGGANAGYHPSGGYNQQSSSRQGQQHFNQMQNSQQQFPHAMNNYQQNRFQGNRGGGGYSQQSRDYGRDRQTSYGQYAGRAQQDVGAGAQPSSNVDEFGRDVQKKTVPEQTDNAEGGDSTAAAAQKPDSVPVDTQHQANEESLGGLGDTQSHQNFTDNVNEKSNDDELLPGGVDDEQSLEGKDNVKPAQAEEEELSLQPIAVLTTNDEFLEDPSVQSISEPIPLGPAIPAGPASHYLSTGLQDFSGRGRGGMRGFGRGNFRGRGGFGQMYNHMEVMSVEPMGQGVAGAPTGPKAMRDGQPNTGFRGRAGFQAIGRATKTPAPLNGPAASVGKEK